jgi:hypothetical protein
MSTNIQLTLVSHIARPNIEKYTLPIVGGTTKLYGRVRGEKLETTIQYSRVHLLGELPTQIQIQNALVLVLFPRHR